MKFEEINVFDFPHTERGYKFDGQIFNGTFFHFIIQLMTLAVIAAFSILVSVVNCAENSLDRESAASRVYFLHGISGKTMPNNEQFKDLQPPQYQLGKNIRIMATAGDPTKRLTAFDSTFGSNSEPAPRLLRDHLQTATPADIDLVVGIICANTHCGTGRNEIVRYLTHNNLAMPRIPPEPQFSWEIVYIPVLIWYSIVGLIFAWLCSFRIGLLIKPVGTDMWAQMIYYLPFWVVMTFIGGVATLTPMAFVGVGRLGGKMISGVKIKRQKNREAKFFGKDLLALEARLAKAKQEADAMKPDGPKDAMLKNIADAHKKLAEAKNLREQKRVQKTDIPAVEGKNRLAGEIQDIETGLDGIIESEKIK